MCKLYVGPYLVLDGFPDSYLDKVKLQSEGPNPDWDVWNMKCQLNYKLRYSPKNPEPERDLQFWKQTGDRLRVPRGLLSNILRDYPETEVISHLVSPLPETSFNFVPEYRVGQEEAVVAMSKVNFGILEAPTGSGKTIMGLALAAKLGFRTLFVVHTNRLLEQTVKEVKKLFGIDPGIIGDGKYKLGDFTVASVQTLYERKDKIAECFKYFGTVIFDECHRYAASTFAEVVELFYAQHVYGLSATLNRKDGKRWVMHAIIGPLAHSVSRQMLQKAGSIIKPDVYTVNTPFVPSVIYDDFEIATHLNEVAEDEVRNEFLLEDILSKLEGKRSVALSHRISQLDWLGDKLKEKGVDCVVLHGKMTKAAQKKAAEKMKNDNPVISLSTYSMLSEGFDAPDWDQIFLLTPSSSEVTVIQAIGRICRSAKDKKRAVVWDYVDIKDPVLKKRANSRQYAYAKL